MLLEELLLQRVHATIAQDAQDTASCVPEGSLIGHSLVLTTQQPSACSKGAAPPPDAASGAPSHPWSSHSTAIALLKRLSRYCPASPLVITTADRSTPASSSQRRPASTASATQAVTLALRRLPLADHCSSHVSSSSNDGDTTITSSRGSSSSEPGTIAGPRRQQQRHGRQRQLGLPDKWLQNTNSAAAELATHAEAAVSNEPVQWLAGQHPAVRACLHQELAAASWQLQHSPQQLDVALHNSTAASQPLHGNAAAALHAPCAGFAGFTVKRTVAVPPLLLQPPALAGAGPTIVFPPLPGRPLPCLEQQYAAQCVSTNATVSSSTEGIEAGNGVSSSRSGGSGRGSNSASSVCLTGLAATGSQLVPLPSVRLLVRYQGVANKPVKEVFRAAGFRRVKADAGSTSSAWHVHWGSSLSQEELALLQPFQRVNHFPGTWELGRKDRLYLNLAAAARRTRGLSGGCSFGELVPSFWIMPRDLDAFRLELTGHPGRTYIRKPVASSRGRGVSLLRDPQAYAADPQRAEQDSGTLIQRYISEPLLVGGHKFDMRVYVAVTGLEPLRVYVHEQGLVRFATMAYQKSRSTLGHQRMHLTNYSVNKKAATFRQPTWAGASCSSAQGDPAGSPCIETECGDSVSGETSSSKWSLAALRQHLEQQGMDWHHIWRQVQHMAVQVLIAAEPRMLVASRTLAPPSCADACFFELFGMDVLLDSSQRAWLLEVNTSPALNADSPLDLAIKQAVVADLGQLVGVVPTDAAVFAKQEAAAQQAKLTGLPATSRGPGGKGRGMSGGRLQGGKGRAAAAAEGSLAGVGGSDRLTANAAAAAGAAAGAYSPTAADAAVHPQPRRRLDARPCSSTAAGAASTTHSSTGSSGGGSGRGTPRAAAQAQASLQPPPAVVLTEAEHRRGAGRGFARVFPCPEQPVQYERYLAAFETPRLANMQVRQFYAAGGNHATGYKS